MAFSPFAVFLLIQINEPIKLSLYDATIFQNSLAQIMPKDLEYVMFDHVIIIFSWLAYL